MARRSSSFLGNVGVGAALGVAYYLFLRPQMLTAGTLPGEATGGLPGDEAIASPNLQSTRAINVDAPPEAVWPWIAQMGREHTGFYGLDNLTNQGIPSAAFLRHDLAAPATDMPMNGGFQIMKVEINRLLLYGSFDLPTLTGEPMEMTTLLLLTPRAGSGSRLLIRTRGYTYGPLGTLYNLAYEVFDYFNATAQLQNIRGRAETMARLVIPASNGALRERSSPLGTQVTR